MNNEVAQLRRREPEWEDAIARERRDLEYHQARVLLLLAAFSGTRGKLDGLTKLVKLDFLLRYPAFLERVLPGGAGDWTDETRPTTVEREAVESRMVRYKYGPWDDRYYPIVGALVGRGLAEYAESSRDNLALRPTAAGRALARTLAVDPQWVVISARCALLRQHLNLSGNRLKNLIYERLPDAMDRPHRSLIT